MKKEVKLSAVAMAQRKIRSDENQPAISPVQSIAMSQQYGIDTMQSMLATLNDD
ncbi:MAG: hypothetical protein ACSLE7_02645 [Mycobacterium sp.]